MAISLRQPILRRETLGPLARGPPSRGLSDILADTKADTIDTNADTNLHEQRRTCTMREPEDFAYLQVFLNIGEQPRRHRSVIPLNGVSRVQIPPPPLQESLICRINAQVKYKGREIPALLYTNEYTTYMKGPFLGQRGLHGGGSLIPHPRQDVRVAVQRHRHRRMAQQLLHQLGVVAAGEQQRGAGVA